MNVFFRAVSVTGFGLSLAAAVIFLCFGQWAWASGVMVGAFWVFLNSYFLCQLLEMSLNTRALRKDRVLILLILKFPVLYLAGFFILQSRFFPVGGVLLGLSFFFLAFGVRWFSANAGDGKALGGGAS